MGPGRVLGQKRSGYPGGVSSQQEIEELFALVQDWTTVPDVAEALDVKVTKVHQLVSERALLTVRGTDGVRRIPALFMDGDSVLDSLKGTLTVLFDAGFTDEEAITWLFTEDESLPGRPVDALHQGRKTEIRRRAQALAW